MLAVSGLQSCVQTPGQALAACGASGGVEPYTLPKCVQIAWSGALAVRGAAGGVRRFALLAMGVRSGRVWLWRAELPHTPCAGAGVAAIPSRIALVLAHAPASLDAVCYACMLA